MTNLADLLRDLGAVAPELEVARQAHVAYYGELLAHVLFGDVTRWVVERGPGPEVRDVLGVLERHLDEGDEDVQEVLILSFLYNLFGDDPSELAIQAALGPHLRAKFDAMMRPTPRDPGAAT